MLPSRYRPEGIGIVRDNSSNDIATCDTKVPLHARDEAINFGPARHEDNKAFCELLRIKVVQQTCGFWRCSNWAGGKCDVAVVSGHFTSLEL